MGAPRGTPRKVDANHHEIVQALRKVGADIIDLSALGQGCPDLCVSFRDVIYLIEIKNPKARGKLNKRQEEWHLAWQGRKPDVVNDVDEALRAIGAI